MGLTYTGRGRGSHDESVRVLTVGGGFKPSEYLRTWTTYFTFLRIFLIKEKNENEQGNGGFTDVTSEQLHFEHKIAPEIK